MNLSDFKMSVGRIIVFVATLFSVSLAESDRHDHFHYHGDHSRTARASPYSPYPYQGYYGGYGGIGSSIGGGYGGYGSYPGYGYPYGYPYSSPYGYGGYGYGYEDPYLHLNKRELVGGALLLGAGIVKGVVATSIFNSLNSGVQIGKK